MSIKEFGLLNLERPTATNNTGNILSTGNGNNEMSQSYASRLKEYPNKGVCGLPELQETTRSYNFKRQQLADLVRKHKGRIVVLTGAGISTSAGIPDFRGPQGVWTMEQKEKKNHKKSKKQQPSKKRPRSSKQKPEEESISKDSNDEESSVTRAPVMDFSHAQPTLTHKALYYLTEHTKTIQFCITQNVDGLHVKSGMRRERLAILHGCVFTEKCELCGTEHVRDYDTGGMSFQQTGRSCTKCQAPLRDTLLDWKDPLPKDDFERACGFCEQASVVLCLGTSLRIEPAGSLPTLAEKYVICNLQPTPYDTKAHLVIRARVDRILQDLLEDLGYSGWERHANPTEIQQIWCNKDSTPEYRRTWWCQTPESDSENEEGEGEQAKAQPAPKSTGPSPSKRRYV